MTLTSRKMTPSPQFSFMAYQVGIETEEVRTTPNGAVKVNIFNLLGWGRTANQAEHLAEKNAHLISNYTK